MKKSEKKKFNLFHFFLTKKNILLIKENHGKEKSY